MACAKVCFLRSTLDQIISGYKIPNNAPNEPKSNINAAFGPDNAVVWTLIFHFEVINNTTPVLTE